MGNSPSAPPPSGSSDSKRGSSFSFSLRLKRPRAQLDQQYDEGATLPVIAPLSERRPSTPLTPGAPETSQGVLSEEDEVENILDTPRDHSPTIPQTPPIINPGPTIGKKREEVSTVRTSSAAEPDHHNKGNATDAVHLQPPSTIADSIVLPATVHSHIRHYIYFGEPLEFSLRLQSVLPASHFHPLYLDFRKTVGLTTPLPWAYDIFSIVVEEYGQQLHDNHDNIDWDSAKQRMTLSADEGIASLQQRYREHIAPIVSRWLREVNLALTCLRLDETFPVFADGQLRPETHQALRDVLSSIASVLGHTEAWESLASSSGFLKPSLETNCSEWTNCLLAIAHSEVGREVFCEVRGKPSQLLVDTLDKSICAIADTVSPERSTLIWLHAHLVANSGEFPSRLQIPPIELPWEKDLYAGSMGISNLPVNGTLRSVCFALDEHNVGRPGDQWESYQNYLRGLAFSSELRHPNLLPLLGVCRGRYRYPYFVHPLIPRIDDRFPFSIEPKRSDLLMLEIAKALQYLHAHDIVHSDLQWPNFVINGNHVAMWNFGFSRTRHHEATSGWRDEYAPYHFAERKPSKVKDIFSCAMLFLSLGLAAVGASGPQDLGGGMQDFRAVATALMSSVSYQRPRPPVPPRLLDSNCFGDQKGEVVWKLILDMVDPDNTVPLSMDTIVARLTAIISE